MIKQFLATLLLLVLVGCADEERPIDTKETKAATLPPSETPERPTKSPEETAPLHFCEGSRYTVRVHPDMATRFEPIRKGVAKWQSLMEGKASFDVLISKEARPRWESCIITFVWDDLTADGPWAAAAYLNPFGENTPGGRPGTGVVFFNSNDFFTSRMTDETAYAITLHELGHVIGLDHDQSREHETVMWPFVTEPGRVGCEDVRRVGVIWGFKASCEGNGWVE